MYTYVVTVKLTESEIDVLDWLTTKWLCMSRSDTLRIALLTEAQHYGLPRLCVEQVMEERRRVPPRTRRRSKR